MPFSDFSAISYGSTWSSIESKRKLSLCCLIQMWSKARIFGVLRFAVPVSSWFELSTLAGYGKPFDTLRQCDC